MNIIRSESSDPYFNIAAEEYLFKNKIEDYFFLYRNNPSVIIGKHQNPFAESNIPFLHQNGIPVIRRLSGGGTVYHDSGNVNFSFIRNKSGKNLVDFKIHIDPLYHFLKQLGLNVVYSKRNDLFLEGKKISGNAEHVVKDRILHHGTLLFNADLQKLGLALRTGEASFTGRAIASQRSPVTCIALYLKSALSINDFCIRIAETIADFFDFTREYSFGNKEIDDIYKLIEKKYNTWEWNYGYTPDFNIKKHNTLDGKEIETEIRIRKGIIRNIELNGDPALVKKFSWMKTALLGQQYSYEKIAATYHETNQLNLSLLF